MTVYVILQKKTAGKLLHNFDKKGFTQLKQLFNKKIGNLKKNIQNFEISKKIQKYFEKYP